MSAHAPSEGDRYIKRNAPNAGRIVTVNRVWTADDGHTAVAYEWRDDKPGQCGSACPLNVFHRTYRAEGAAGSARDAINNLGDCYLTPGVHKRLMALVDQHAHELAEKIRNSERLIEFTDDHMSDMYEAANEIDPEASNSGG